MSLSGIPSPQEPGYPFRVFISYAHADIDLVTQISSLLERELDLQPLWDREITPGTPFTDSIKDLIARAHIFVTIITENSHNRPWIHEETGYASALKIPIIPIAIGNLPSEMIASLQAISVRRDLKDLVELFREIDLDKLVVPKPIKPGENIVVAQWPETRTDWLVRHINWVTALGVYGHVRQQAGLSSFSLPDKDLDHLDHLDWLEGEGGDYLKHLQKEERRGLEVHLRQAGGSLIIDPEKDIFNTPARKVRQARLSILLEFLRNVPHDKLRIVISSKALESNLVIVGDYFFAESYAPRQGGYMQTVFNSHAPTVLERSREFDAVFKALYPTQGVSVEEVIVRIQNILDHLPN